MFSRMKIEVAYKSRKIEVTVDSDVGIPDIMEINWITSEEDILNRQISGITHQTD